MTRTRSRAFFMGLIVALMSAGAVGHAGAEQAPALSATGMFTLQTGQTARLHVANTDELGNQACVTDLRFADNSGGYAATQTFRIVPQTAVFFEFAYDEAISIRAMVVPERSCRRATPFLLPSVEILDSRTGAVVSFVPTLLMPIYPPGPCSPEFCVGGQ
jgi:hypothetical protein